MAHLSNLLYFSGSCGVNKVVLAGLCTLCVCTTLRSQDTPAPATSPSAVDDLALKQSQVADKYKRLEELMFKMAALEAGTNPRRAALLTRAVEQSKEKLTKAQLETLVKLIGQKQLKRALDEQTAVQSDLKSLLELLMSEDRSDRLKSEQARIREYIKEVERLIRLEKSIQGQTEGGGDEKRLAKDQGDLAKRTGDLAQKIKESEEGAAPGEESESSESKPQEGEEAKPQDGKPNDGKPSDSKPQESKGKGKPEGKPSDGKGDQDKPDDGKPQDSKGEKTKSQDAKPEDAKSEDSKGEKGAPQESKGKPSDGKSKSNQGQKGKPQESKGEPDEPQQGESGEQQEQDQQAQQDNPARKRIEQAQQKMRDAQQKLEQAKRKESVEDQRQAKEELEKAKAELEEILRQLREEEIARTLAMLEARFRKMLEMQLRVYESTRRLDQVTQQNRNEQFVVQSGKLAIDEQKIAVEAQKALTLLQEEGSSVAFPASVEAMHEDMDQVANRLADTKVDDITVGIEEDVIAALEEMIQALQKAQQDMEKQQQQQQQQQGQEQDQSLVDEIAELKMIKALQERVNKRTVRYARLLEDDQDAVGQADGVELVNALKKLSERQQEIFRITRDIVLGKNK